MKISIDGLRILAVAWALWSGFVSPARAGDAYEWTQVTSEGLELRAVTQAAACPEATIDGRPAPMSVRAAPNATFPILVCALRIPAEAKEAAIRDRPAPLAPRRVDRMALIGDTGCRLLALATQRCNDPHDWPFRLMADSVADMGPQLVLHVGDLIYRERACPVSNKGCAGSPWGDNWETWKAEFFDPARGLLATAPFVFVRGNHEDCARNGAGWARLVSPFPFTGNCAPQEAAYSLDLGSLTLAVLDVTRAEDSSVDDATTPFFREQFSALAALPSPVWVAMHKGVYGSVRFKNGVNEGHNVTLGEAARGAMPPNVTAMISGHLHVFQALGFAEDVPAQIISGTGGDALDSGAPEDLVSRKLGDATVEKGLGVSTLFGFTIMERGANDWLVSHYDAHERLLARCRLTGRKVGCE